MIKPIVIDLVDVGQKIVLTAPVLDHLKNHRQLEITCLEAGGQLFARLVGTTVIVEIATGPRKTDRRGRYWFIPSRFLERREIRKLFKRGYHYVGDWHSHPEPRPQPSQTDIDSMCEMYNLSRHKLSSFLMVIVGTDPGRKGMFVALCNGTSIRTL